MFEGTSVESGRGPAALCMTYGERPGMSPGRLIAHTDKDCRLEWMDRGKHAHGPDSP